MKLGEKAEFVGVDKGPSEVGHALGMVIDDGAGVGFFVRSWEAGQNFLVCPIDGEVLVFFQEVMKGFQGADAGGFVSHATVEHHELLSQ
mgnify:FL=1